MFQRIRDWYKGLPEKKRWIDVVTAVLTIPVLLTVVISNFLTIQSKKNAEKDNDSEVVTTQAPINITVENPAGSDKPGISPSPEINLNPSCNPDLPEYEIISPKENEIVSNDPLCIVHVVQGSGFCQATWSYRINKSSWPPYTDQPVCLYNMASGDIEFELKVKNEKGDEEVYTRNFLYDKKATSSASLE